MADATPVSVRDRDQFEPTPAHYAIADALNDQTAFTNTAALAEAADCSIRTLQRAISSPAVLSWIIAQQTSIVESRLGAIHARIFDMAMTSRSSSWAKLFLERFDVEFKKQKVLERGHNQQNNFLGDMSHDELVKSIGRAFRKLQGATGIAPPTGQDVPGVLGQDREPGGLPTGDVSIPSDRHEDPHQGN